MSSAVDPTGWPPTDGQHIGPGWRRRLLARLAPPYTLVLALIFAGALVVAWAVLPGEDERIEALERDGQTSRAFTLLQARFDRGDRRQRTLVSLRRFYDYYGDSEKSQQVLELLAQLRPRDLFIQRQLAQLYRVGEDLPGQIRALKAQLVIRYSEPVCQRLVGLEHLSSDYAAEYATLIDCHARGYRRPDGLVRLASLYAVDGKLDRTAEILGAVDDRRWLRGSHERLMLFDALISTNLPKDALRRGIRWYKGQPDQDLALEMISRLVAAEHNDLGLQMARQVGTPGDPVTLAAGEILVDQVQYEAARAFLSGWLAQSPAMSTETAVRFVAAAVDADDPALALQCAEKHGLDRFRSSDLVALAEALLAAGLTGDFDKVRAHLTPESIQADALLAAAIDLRDGRLDEARATLTAMTIDPADERRAALKVHLAALAGRPPVATRLIREPNRTDIQAPVAGPAGETQTRRASPSLDIARRFKRYRRRRIVVRSTPTLPVAAKPSPAPLPLTPQGP